MPCEQNESAMATSASVDGLRPFVVLAVVRDCQCRSPGIETVGEQKGRMDPFRKGLDSAMESSEDLLRATTFAVSLEVVWVRGTVA